MYRKEFPRIYELRDLLPGQLPEGLRFPALDDSIGECPQKGRFLREVENDLEGLDATAGRR